MKNVSVVRVHLEDKESSGALVFFEDTEVTQSISIFLIEVCNLLQNIPELGYSHGKIFSNIFPDVSRHGMTANSPTTTRI